MVFQHCILCPCKTKYVKVRQTTEVKKKPISIEPQIPRSTLHPSINITIIITTPSLEQTFVLLLLLTCFLLLGLAFALLLGVRTGQSNADLEVQSLHLQLRCMY
jgi:hypothetical protein